MNKSVESTKGKDTGGSVLNGFKSGAGVSKAGSMGSIGTQSNVNKGSGKAYFKSASKSTTGKDTSNQ